LRDRLGGWRGAFRARHLVVVVGIATMACGFLVGALLNLYLLAIHEPLVQQFRSTLTYSSAILGDGLVLPIVNMIATSWLIKERAAIKRSTVRTAVLLGLAMTVYIHIDQAVNEVVNWAMPTPWHWNSLGVGHALYMLTVTSFLSLFLLVVVRATRRDAAVPREAVWALLGIIVFLGLLRLDYWSLSLRALLP